MRQKSSPDKPLQHVTRLARGLKLSANSLLVTLFGDVVAPRPQAIWLGSLIHLVAPFGINDRLVRTSAFRLTADDWLTVTRIGRRSYYAPSDTGLQRMRHADKRIYAGDAPDWNGHWTLALVRGDTRATIRQKLRRELLWDGFGAIAPGVYAHPNADLNALRDVIHGANAGDSVAVLDACDLAPFSTKPLQALIHQTFKLGDVAHAWQAFLRRFERLVPETASLAPADAFFVRILLIHEYRRVLLRDPNLPEELLPPDWPGRIARQICRTLYTDLMTASELYLRQTVEVSEGALVQTPRALRARFSGAANTAGQRKAQELRDTAAGS